MGQSTCRKGVKTMKQNYKKPEIPKIYITFEYSHDVREIECFAISEEKGFKIYQMMNDSERMAFRRRTKLNEWFQRGTNPDRGYAEEVL